MQRIQTLYLLAATALMSIFFFSTIATFIATDGIYQLMALGVKSFDGSVSYNLPYLAIVTALATILPFATIFFFKRRMLQIRLCVVNIVLSLGVVIVTGIYYYLANRFFGSAVGELTNASLRIVCLLPIAAIALSYLALKGVFKDEMLIKSLDRIR